MITFDSLTVDFGQGPVLSSVSLQVARGTMLGLVGPGGGGKSVLLKAACGLVPIQSGLVQVAGISITQSSKDELKKLRATIGMLFQHNALFDFMTVGQNVMFPLTQRGVSETEAATRAQERLEMVGLPKVFSRFPRELSGGMRKRVGVARAIIASPEIVLYDEPTAGLDPVTSSKIFTMLRSEQQSGKRTVIVISNDLDNLLQYVDCVAMLHQGRLLYEGLPSEVQQSPNAAVRQFFRGDTEGPL